MNDKESQAPTQEVPIDIINHIKYNLKNGLDPTRLIIKVLYTNNKANLS